MALTVTVAASNSMGTALATAIGSGGLIRIYSGSKPATPETAASGTLLATVTVTGSFSSTGGVLTAADPGGVTIAATGTAGYFRLLNATGPTAILDGTVGTSATDMILATVALSSGATLDLGVPTITVPVA